MPSVATGTLVLIYMLLETRFSPINSTKSGDEEWIGINSMDCPWHTMLRSELSWFEIIWIIILN